ncbi:uncharacterized protein SAMN02745824_0082 [Parasphingorhabdus marina DSM 22363]|uniref:DUF418 domain-containing protein n=1 Tax=Parasphingorhabdus marina DSM 22363 TaxID=1123272 RepID=A0A1N6CME0_9SPHN|nr:DUF418 domain-containing protein [Parasphingorhabdus marina]SIN59554.1 uncharacterized protein SAMN02745824_0082 [Parasphingorhabdus marina DSM 22363]
MTSAKPALPRHIELDALRGFAVMGILLMNIIGFALLEMAYVNPAVYGMSNNADTISWFLSFVLVDGKMRGLFTLLFGASMMLIIARAEAKGENAAKVHFTRMGWLALFGLAHFFLVWFGDILFLYAVIGCLAWFVADWDSDELIRKALLIYAMGFIAYLLFMGGMFYLEYLAEMAGPGSESDADYRDMLSEIAPGAAVTAEEIAKYQGSYFQILTDKLTNKWDGPLILLVMNGLETLPLMMLGMAFYKNGFMTGQWDAARYRSFGLRLVGWGLLLMLPLAWLVWASGFDPLIAINASLAWSIPSRMLLTLGFAALLILLIQKLAHHSILQRIAAAGRVAFTNYLGTSILMTFIFYGWGLGLFGQFGRAELYLFVLGTWIVMLLWSQPWLSHFRYGPLEWLWRSLARGQMQKMRVE